MGVDGNYIGNGDDYRWDAVLLVTTETTCSGAIDKIGTIEVSGGVAYFDNLRWGCELQYRPRCVGFTRISHWYEWLHLLRWL